MIATFDQLLILTIILLIVEEVNFGIRVSINFEILPLRK